jgi:hypothetical protein
MRWIVPLIVALAVQIAWAGGHGSGHSSGTVHVNGYYRKDGTYVHPYDRAATGTASYSSSVYEPTTRTTSSASVPTTTTYVPAIPNGATVRVHGYYRQDGTYVHEYVRSAPGIADTVISTTTRKAPASAADAAVASTAVAAAAVAQPQTHTHYSGSTSALGAQRDSHGRIKRSESAKHDFMRMTGYPNGRPGYVVDHIIPLKRGGCDCPSNMQWQTIQEAKTKDKWE